MRAKWNFLKWALFWIVALLVLSLLTKIKQQTRSLFRQESHSEVQE